KSFLFREMQEVPLRADRPQVRWHEEGDRLWLHVSEPPAANPVAVVLEPGVREVVEISAARGTGRDHEPAVCRTCGLECGVRAGWARPGAEEGVKKPLSRRDRGRTVRLETPHRMHPELGSFLSDLLFQGAYRLGPRAAEDAGRRPAALPPLGE